MPSDFLTPHTAEMVKNMDFTSEASLNKTQLAILALLPPNNRVLGTMRLRESSASPHLDPTASGSATALLP